MMIFNIYRLIPRVILTLGVISFITTGCQSTPSPINASGADIPSSHVKTGGTKQNQTKTEIRVSAGHSGSGVYMNEDVNNVDEDF